MTQDAILLALIADLYSQVGNLTAENQRLQALLATETEGPADE